jgi:plasmid stabilization system protein ParE
MMYYDRQRAGLGDALRAEVYLAIEQVRSNPLQFAIVEKGIRRCFVHRFPYAVLFRILGDDLIRILVIRHHRRHQNLGTVRR